MLLSCSKAFISYLVVHNCMIKTLFNEIHFERIIEINIKVSL